MTLLTEDYAATPADGARIWATDLDTPCDGGNLQVLGM